jgi:hypothetical protein
MRQATMFGDQVLMAGSPIARFCACHELEKFFSVIFRPTPSPSRTRLQNVAEEFSCLIPGKIFAQSCMNLAVKKRQRPVHKCDGIALYHTSGR